MYMFGKVNSDKLVLKRDIWQSPLRVDSDYVNWSYLPSYWLELAIGNVQGSASASASVIYIYICMYVFRSQLWNAHRMFHAVLPAAAAAAAAHERPCIATFCLADLPGYLCRRSQGGPAQLQAPLWC